MSQNSKGRRIPKSHAPDSFSEPNIEIEPSPLTHEDLMSAISNTSLQSANDADAPAEEQAIVKVDQRSLYWLIEQSLKRTGKVPKELLVRLLTYEQFALRLQCSVRHLKQMKSEGRLIAAPTRGKNVRFSEEEYQRYVREKPSKNKRRKNP